MEDKCGQCGVESEMAIHAVWECATLDEIWEAVPGFEDRRQHSISNTIDLISVLHEKKKNLEIMAMVMWTIWYLHNQLQVSSNEFPRSQVLHQATPSLAIFQQSQQSICQPSAMPRPPPHAQWSPPQPNCFKLNFDGAMFPELGKAGLSVVVHDSQGTMIASLSEQAPMPYSSDIAEAMAATRALVFAQELDIDAFVLERDLEVVINTLRSKEALFSSFGHLLESAKSMLVSSICLNFSHVRRNGNKVAHNLARHARNVRGLSV